MKDSREITDNTRADIVKFIEETSHEKLIVTHGTYTMPTTARYLEKHLSQEIKENKTIVLTGSMRPLRDFTPTDAPYNLGFAMSSVQLLDDGIYVCMNGSIFHSCDVEKDLDKGVFAGMDILEEKTKAPKTSKLPKK